MRRYTDWERGLAIGAFFGSFIGPIFMTILMALVLTYDVYGERAKFLISRGLDKYFQFPPGVSEKLLSNLISPDDPATESSDQKVSTSAPETPKAQPSNRPTTRRPRIFRTLESLAPSGD